VVNPKSRVRIGPFQRFSVVALTAPHTAKQYQYAENS
jgi:hypothetical protein